MLKNDFREIVESFLSLSKITPTKLGCLTLKDPNFVSNVRKGREFRENTRQRVLDWMAKFAAENNIEFDFNGWRG